MQRLTGLIAQARDRQQQRTASGPRRPRSRRRWPWMLAGAGLVALAGVAGYFAVAPERTAERAGERAGAHSVEVALPPLSGSAAAPASPTSGAASDTPAPQPGHAADDLASVRPDPGNGVTVPAVTAAAFAAIPLAAPEAALPLAPDPALTEDAAAGPLPRRGDDGRLPWRAYARPFVTREAQPLVAVIVTGLGLSDTATSEIIRRLPGAVTLAFDPAAADVADWARAARAGGHEILLVLPMQGSAFPFVDKGPDALAPDAAPDETTVRLERLLARMTGYVGVLTDVGGQSDPAGAEVGAEVGAEAVAEAGALTPGAGAWVAPVGDALAARGLLVVDDPRAGVRSGAAGDTGTPRVGADLTMAADSGRAAIRARLAALEALARSRGHAVAVVEPTPLAIAELAAWSAGLKDTDLVLAPVSAVAATAAGLEP